MKNDNILEIGIDEKERLFIKPEKEKFTLIYRTGSGVHWDNSGKFLYSPKPNEWTYLQWFTWIVKIIEDCNCRLLLTDKTVWTNINEELKKLMMDDKKI